MYAYPIYLPEFSNREDLLLTVSLFDDDTGDALDLSYRTLAMPGDYTNNAWIVTDSAIVTASNTSLTIPDFPIGNQLEAVTLTVGVNLGILPGDPITIADPTGKNTMTGYVTSYAAATGALVCQIGITFQFEIRSLKRSNDWDDGYTSSYDAVGSTDYGPIITASLGNGLTIIDLGVLQIRIPELTFRKLHHRSYKASLTMTDSYDTRQPFIARLPIQSGGVSL